MRGGNSVREGGREFCGGGKGVWGLGFWIWNQIERDGDEKKSENLSFRGRMPRRKA